MKIWLNDFAKVKEFIKISQQQKEDVILKSGIYVIDAKSIVGIFSLDLSKPIILETKNKEAFKHFEYLGD